MTCLISSARKGRLMSQYLVFQLHGPMASWGEDAPGEVRHSHELPSRSALLGLLAAALGIRREEEQRLKAFNQHYPFALRQQRTALGEGLSYCTDAERSA